LPKGIKEEQLQTDDPEKAKKIKNLKKVSCLLFQSLYFYSLLRPKKPLINNEKSFSLIFVRLNLYVSTETARHCQVEGYGVFRKAARVEPE
jgi:hypothetical protein